MLTSGDETLTCNACGCGFAIASKDRLSGASRVQKCPLRGLIPGLTGKPFMDWVLTGGRPVGDELMRSIASAIRAVFALVLAVCVSTLAVPAVAHDAMPLTSPPAALTQASAHAAHAAHASHHARMSGPAVKARTAGRKCCPNCDGDALRPGCCAIGHCGSGAALLPPVSPQVMLLVSGSDYFSMPPPSVAGISSDLPSPPPR